MVAVSDDATLARLAPLADRDDVSRFVENRVTTPLMTGAFTAVHAFVEVHGQPGDDLIAEIEALVTADDAVHPVSEYVKK